MCPWVDFDPMKTVCCRGCLVHCFPRLIHHRTTDCPYSLVAAAVHGPCILINGNVVTGKLLVLCNKPTLCLSPCSKLRAERTPSSKRSLMLFMELVTGINTFSRSQMITNDHIRMRSPFEVSAGFWPQLLRMSAAAGLGATLRAEPRFDLI